MNALQLALMDTTQKVRISQPPSQMRATQSHIAWNAMTTAANATKSHLSAQAAPFLISCTKRNACKSVQKDSTNTTQGFE
jgi:hypothetical protein